MAAVVVPSVKLRAAGSPEGASDAHGAVAVMSGRGGWGFWS